MTAYYTKPKGNGKKGKFIYVDIDEEQAKLLKLNVVREIDGHRVDPRLRLHDHGTEYHLTTDGSFDLYLEKRKSTPRKVLVLDTQVQVSMTLEPLGFIL